MSKSLDARLLRLAAVFFVLYAIILTLSPAVRERTWSVDYRWQHWLGILVWGFGSYYLLRTAQIHLTGHDPFLIPLLSLLTGVGLMTIWRLTPGFGLRQTFWVALAFVLMALGVRFHFNLNIIRRYKYLLLSFGLFLTALTMIFGTNPEGFGPRLWLGCCGIYLQPSEPLKLLLISYLSAYLADRLPARNRLIPLLFPTLFLTGLALLLLLVQRDLGTASIFILLYATIVFIGTGHRRVLLVSAILLILAGLLGYLTVDLIHLRVESWLNPWLDPSGNSYQIIQSLLAIANGGLLGRGPGLGNPTLVPISHSDFIFTAIAEELGLIGVIAMLVLFALLIGRALLIAMRATGRFQRLMAIGISAYFSIQSLLIIGGNLRVLPLTGVTLPFVSYGGSSLLTAFIAGLILLLISSHTDEDPAPLVDPSPYYILHGMVSLGLVMMSVGAGWWTLFRGADLLTRTDNPRRSISDRYVKRGALLDRNNLPINLTIGQTGEYIREYAYPELGPVTGYTHPVFGQAGLESSLDEYLRGMKGNPASLIWWHRLLYGTPPPGINVRLSLEMSLQTQADRYLGEHAGAIVILNSSSGEVLAMASHPTYDPGNLDVQGSTLAEEESSPLINRASQGHYSPISALEPFSQILLGTTSPLNQEQQRQVIEALGFNATPQIRMPVAEVDRSQQGDLVSPLQMAMATAALSHDGILPAPRVALAANTPQQGWIILPALSQPRQILPASQANLAVQSSTGNSLYWQYSNVDHEAHLTWFLAGTLPGWKGTPLALTILLEEENPGAANSIAEALLPNTLNTK